MTAESAAFADGLPEICRASALRRDIPVYPLLQ
jgi:hypothetical protein